MDAQFGGGVSMRRIHIIVILLTFAFSPLGWGQSQGTGGGQGTGGPSGGNSITTSAQVIALFTGCTGVQYLGADGACHAAGGAPAESSITGSTAATSITEVAAGDAITRAGVETANLTYPWVIQNTNATNTTTGALAINTAGAGTGQIPLLINEATAAGDLVDAYTGGSFAAGVYTAGTKQFSVSSVGAVTALGIVTSGSNGGITGSFCMNGSTSGNLCMISNATSTGIAFGSNIQIPDNAAFRWSQSGVDTGTPGLSMYANGTGVNEAIDFTGGTSTGLGRFNECRIASTGITLTTQTTICSWPLTNTGLTWSWQCQGTYSTSAVSIGFTLGMIVAQTPTAAIQGSATMDTAASGTATQVFATATDSNTVATAILTGTPATALSNLPWTSNGTIPSNATTAGTFILYGTASTTSDVIVYGTCILY